LILSKHPFISPSKTHSRRTSLTQADESLSARNLCALLNFLNPNERGSAVVSAIGLNARVYNACIALSCKVGILNGRFLSVPGLGI
jgi:hypothetical protein